LPPSSQDPQGLSAKKLELLRTLLREEGLAAGASDAVRPRPAGTAPPLSFAQERLWFFERMAPGSPVFNVPALYDLAGELDAARLERALAAVWRRHEVLASTFASEDGRPVCRLDGAEPPRPQEVDLRGASSAELDERVRAEVLRPFDLERGPLLRLVLLRGPTALGDRLLVVIHHVVAEIQSIGILMADLAAAYTALAAGREPDLPPLPVQFGDFALWQRQRAAANTSSLEYWRTTLGGRLPVLQLPTDRPRPAVQTFHGATRTRALPAALARELRDFCRRERVTPFTAVLAAWSALLSRYAGQEDVLVGAPMTDRNRPELQDLVGFFVNTLVLRCDLSGRPSFRELVGRAREVVLGAQAHQDTPFEALVDALAPERDLSRSPVFQVALLLQNASEGGAELLRFGPDATCRPHGDPLAAHTRTSKFDCSLILWDRGGEDLAASFEFNTDLFDAATMERLLEHLEVLLGEALARSDAPAETLGVLSPAERERVVGGWNRTATQTPGGATIHGLFEDWARRTPDALAAAEGARRLTYRELDERANQLARVLRERGIGRDVPVAVCTGRTLELLVGVLGTLKAGGCYLPIDLDYPADRLAYMLADAGAPVALSHPDHRERVPEHGGETLVLDLEHWAHGDRSAEALEVDVAERDLAYVIYTSGSTGRPKGVELEHRGLVNLTVWHQRAYAVAPRDRATHLAGLAFDASVWEVWPYLCGGASLHLVADDVRLSPPRLLAWLTERRITQSFLPTPLAEALLQEPCPADLSLEWVLTGGDKLHRPPPPGWPFRLVNHYGPTENTVVATCCEVPAAEAFEQSPPIGGPIDNVQVYVLNAGLQPQPIGVPGELCVGGRSLARGYRGRPEMTAEKFVPDPLSAEPDARLYRTGDLVQRRADGQIEFLGRLDGQVKVRGFRIELGEIEAVLAGHPDVAECCVVVLPDASSAPALYAYVVAPATAGRPAPDATALRAHLAAALPAYMVPASFTFLDALPLTPNGKVDRRALPEPDRTQAAGDAVWAAPEGAVECAIAEVWRGVLEVERVGANTNFFEAGGHSLMMARVHARLCATLDRELSIVDLFQFPTIRLLAAHLAGAGRTDAATETAASPAAAPGELATSRRRGAARLERMQRRRGR